jgi:VanZ family protein
VALWLVVITGLGTDPFQYQQTSRFIGPLLHWLFPGWSNAQVLLVHGWIRKSAHITEYGVAAVLTFRALWLTGRAHTRLAALLPILTLVATLALADEVRQLMVPSRTGSARDVAIDVTGGMVGLVLAPWIVPWLVVRRHRLRGEEATDA